jgi:hypothetical protein
MRSIRRVALSIFGTLVLIASPAIAGPEDAPPDQVNHQVFQAAREAKQLGMFIYEFKDTSTKGAEAAKKYAPKPSDRVPGDIDKWLEKVPKRSDWKADVSDAYYKAALWQHGLVKKHREALGKLFQELRLVGTTRGEFAYSAGISIPVTFAVENGSPVVMVTGIALPKVVDARGTTEKTRAASAVTSAVLPSLKKIDEVFGPSEFGYYGVAVMYACRDADGQQPKTEFACLIVPKELCKKYVDGKITDQELVDGGQVYLSDRDMINQIKKSKLELK